MGTFLAKLRDGLKKTRSNLLDGIGAAISGKRRLEENDLECIEERLIAADIGVDTSMAVIAHLRQWQQNGGPYDETAILERIKLDLAERLQGNHAGAPGHSAQGQEQPQVILVVGVNGVGKTTTIGKLAYLFQQQGKKVLLGAADTFRAAASSQLEIWARRARVQIVRNTPGADPAAVAFDTVNAAFSRGVDVAIIDTAGRLHTRTNLMAELQKVKRVVAQRLPGAPHEVFLILDATTGQNGFAQAKQFHEALHVTGLVVTKLDGTAKGGIIFAIKEKLNIPIRYIGVGEHLDDLQPFEAQTYIEALFT